MSNPKLLIIEDDDGLASQYRWAFPGFEVMLAQAREPALALARKERPPVAILDLGLPPDADGTTEGFAALEELQRLAPEMKIVIATGSGDRAHALRAIAGGATDFCEKPVDVEVLRTIVARALRLHELEFENRRLAAAPPPVTIRNLVTASDAMLRVSRTIERLAATHVTVLLLGESGTGKEVLARALHELGPRSTQPFVALNCGAIPEALLESELFGHERGAFTGAIKQTIGKIEAAHRGTLFLDEIGDLPAPLQVKLLRVLQDQVIERVGGRAPIQVDVRILSATNQSLEERVGDGRFRADLFYRLNSVTVRIPPLRDRGGDAVLLARYFLGRFNREFGRSLAGFTDDALAAIEMHAWPGNVREMENRMKRAVVMAERRLIEPSDLELEPPHDTMPDLDLRAARLRAEREVIQMALSRSSYTLASAAKLLGISRPTLYGLMEVHGIAPKPQARGSGAEFGDIAEEPGAVGPVPRYERG